VCGIFGIHSREVDVANLTYFGLFALQHRGQESAGIAVGDGDRVQIHRDVGLVAQVFNQDVIAGMKGIVAVGHTRYSTTGANRQGNAHPVPFRHPVLGPAAIAHNGNLINSAALRAELEAEGITFESGLDTEVMARMIEHTHGSDWVEVLKHAFPRFVGAYSCAIVTSDSVIALRDPFGFRPLCLGFIPRRPGGGGTRRSNQPAHVVASETCALDTVNATYVREVQPGEMVVLDEHGPTSIQFQQSGRHALCVFEFIYFARPDSLLKGCELEEARLRMGRELASESPVEADMVIGLPDSGTPSAIGYAEASGIPYREGLVKSRYINRTFIQPDQSLREAGVMLKLNPLRRSLRDKRVIAVDDSIVRGTTSQRIIQMLRDAGAREVHMRISSPPMRYPCFMGVDIGSTKQLVAAGRSVEEVRALIGADSLAYLSIPALMRAIGYDNADQFCRACFDGAYPVPVPQQLEMDKMALESWEPRRRPDGSPLARGGRVDAGSGGPLLRRGRRGHRRLHPDAGAGQDYHRGHPGPRGGHRRGHVRRSVRGAGGRRVPGGVDGQRRHQDQGGNGLRPPPGHRGGPRQPLLQRHCDRRRPAAVLPRLLRQRPARRQRVRGRGEGAHRCLPSRRLRAPRRRDGGDARRVRAR
jgi:amidophosphoribosyltransferase